MRANPISIAVFLCGVITAAIAFYARQRRTTRGSQIFSYFMASVTVYVLAYSLELASLDVPTMLLWSKIGYLGIFFFPNLFLIFVLQYTGQVKWLTARNIFFLFLVPALLLFAKFSDDIFHLVYAKTWVNADGVIPLLGFTRGPIYPFALYACIPLLTGVLLLCQKRLNAPLIFRKQAGPIVAGAILPLLVFIIYMSGCQPFPGLKYFDINPVMITLSGIGMGWGAFRSRLFELAPIARDALIERLSDGVIVLDDQTRLVDANPMAMKILGWTQAPVGQVAGQIFSAWKELGEACQTSGPDDPVQIEIQQVVGSNRAFFDLNATPLQDEHGGTVGRLIVIHDITERKQLEEKLRELSLVDDLTGLSNRRGYYILANQFLSMAKRMNLKAAVIFGDLDWLKKINDSLGHAAGDQALVDTANILRSASRSADILARWGGDEFVVLAMVTDEHFAEAMLERLHSRQEELNTQENRKYQISVSFGLAYFDPAQPTTLDELMEAADQAMYIQKQAKKRATFSNL